MSSFTVLNPATGAAVRDVALASVDETDAAIARAVRAQRAWAELAPVARADALRDFARVVEDHVEELAQLEVLEAGHPISSARWEASHVAQVLNYYAGAPERLIGSQIPVAGGLDVTYHEPYGVVGIIVPWNFPMTIAAWGFAPALAAGNAVVLKPAEMTPLTAMRLGDLALEAGLPDGVFAVIPGAGPVVGERFVTHPDVRKVVFTGSTRVGTEVAAGCARELKPVTLELGGKSANIVFADADLEAAAAAVPGSVFDNAGQDCCARSRLLVERSVSDRFLELVEPAVAAWRVGDPNDESTEMGPLISAGQRDRVAGYVDGADVAFRGSAPDGDGFWFAPTVVLAGRGDRIATEEVFGPVVAVLPFDDEADAVSLANDTVYGLAGSIWTSDLGRGIRVSRGVQSGVLSVNSHSSVRYTTPFGGMKASGLGRELGPDAAEHFTQTKNVFYATS
ncbi:aldehyde dehydrogenase family protein [Microbacterium sp. EYE_5]|uniref:aldehyde dehydrogenase family protein n=1 Tax=unclassified Microbacterium TaxID=2609290 RepID=UPI0020063BF6|nr:MULTISPECIES: aldehyde dehydrogenase family protein [unclassified Microbacterium]MCK6079805.1 aldehyde dehydrogenase family protein [Microbacterium sp. EYE_382]MCK6085076.1 aldehyde dehydrogenase family protein [Microbacterium sp. EYE_384]MCK6122698.1 aldehyde dehydrogenase family protein [Microbacterium sp. EYE_80]MCK6125839.1 aldehyde dehydrogenase family protein [Microbacterium sp. EYE_79]MCK6140760.1 aldehyde dehydrogenase family protein [Microbacterium sp. EYE_39]